MKLLWGSHGMPHRGTCRAALHGGRWTDASMGLLKGSLGSLGTQPFSWNVLLLLPLFKSQFSYCFLAKTVATMGVLGVYKTYIINHPWRMGYRSRAVSESKDLLIMKWFKMPFSMDLWDFEDCLFTVCLNCQTLFILNYLLPVQIRKHICDKLV